MEKLFQHLLGHLERLNEKVKEKGLAFFGQIGLREVLGVQIHKYKYTNTQIQFGQICR